MSSGRVWGSSKSQRFLLPKEQAKSFATQEDGGLTIFAVFLFLAIFALTGIAVDVMNYERDRANLQWTLDNAVLSAASLEQKLDPAEVVQAHLDVRGLGEYQNSISVQDDYLDRTVTASLSKRFSTNFMQFSGVESLPMNVSSAANEAAPHTEISLVIDISGSMGSNNRMELMQAAAKAFITKSLSRNEDPSTGQKSDKQTSINVVPFAGQTNPGATMFEYLGGERFGTTTEEDHFQEWEQDVSNVVFWFDTDSPSDGVADFSAKIEGYPGNDVELFNKDDVDTYHHYVKDFIITKTAALPETATMLGASIKGGKQTTQYFSLDHTVTTDGSTKFNQVDLEYQFDEFYSYVSTIPNNVSSCLEMEYSDFMTSQLPSASNVQVPYFVNWDYDETTQNWGWCPDDEMSIKYAQNDELLLNNFIDNLRLFDGTGTNYSLKYALALLDPSSRDAFAHLSAAGEIPAEFANRPLNWDHEDTSKYIVIMTDGRTSPQVRPTDQMEEENGLTELISRPSEDTTITSSQTTNLQLFKQQCELAKANNVIIYAVAFETSDQAAAEIKACASSPSHYYEVTGDEIIDSFVSIAGSIQKLRLIQ
ncbi:Tad domain-containing protein [Ruegeria sp. HKCCA5426]|uniref:Tad domain-containing protein n=1 Tax=Ruegeria sp. HKCCA5426 TaxID=2682985 RepID=UPI001488182B|nr:Tad domain-containing protein [Ruegeria sp. HKCCA5426]